MKISRGLWTGCHVRPHHLLKNRLLSLSGRISSISASTPPPSSSDPRDTDLLNTGRSQLGPPPTRLAWSYVLPPSSSHFTTQLVLIHHGLLDCTVCRHFSAQPHCDLLHNAEYIAACETHSPAEIGCSHAVSATDISTTGSQDTVAIVHAAWKRRSQQSNHLSFIGAGDSDTKPRPPSGPYQSGRFFFESQKDPTGRRRFRVCS